MKVIQDIELLKKLQPYIDFETEYGFVKHYHTKELLLIKTNEYASGDIIYKTLTTDEAYNLLLDNIGEHGSISIGKNDTDFFPINGEHCINYIGRININQLGEMLNYLIDNNLLLENTQDKN